jgi:hypothetical protein
MYTFRLFLISSSVWRGTNKNIQITYQDKNVARSHAICLGGQNLWVLFGAEISNFLTFNTELILSKNVRHFCSEPIRVNTTAINTLPKQGNEHSGRKRFIAQVSINLFRSFYLASRQSCCQIKIP